MANGNKTKLWLSIASAIIGLLGGFFGQPVVTGLTNVVVPQVVSQTN